MSKHKSRKIRRKSGRVYSKYYDPENGEYYNIYWDDWNDFRDGGRQLGGVDKTKLTRISESNQGKIPERYGIKRYVTNEIVYYWDDEFQKMHRNNNKLKKLLARRKLRKFTPV